MFEASFNPWCRWLVATVHRCTGRLSHALDLQRSNYPIPPGLGGPTVKLLLNAALPWLAR